MRPTPLTDAEMSDDYYCHDKVDIEFARRLERERAELIEALLALTETGHTPEDARDAMLKAHAKADDLLERLGALK